MGEPITGTAAGVPYTALPPLTETDAVVVSWHMMDAPRTNAAFAAALPLNDVPAWRIHLGMPHSGARMIPGEIDEVLASARRDPVRAFFAPFVRQAVEEFPGALAEARRQLSIGEGQLAALGGSLGGAVVLQNLTAVPSPAVPSPAGPFVAAAIVNPMIRLRSGVGLFKSMQGEPYAWDEESGAAADALDFVARAGELGDAPLLVVSGELDHADFRADAGQLADARPNTEVVTIAGLAHPLADEPGVEPAPQWPVTQVVDQTISEWFARHL